MDFMRFCREERSRNSGLFCDYNMLKKIIHGFRRPLLDHAITIADRMGYRLWLVDSRYTNIPGVQLTVSTTQPRERRKKQAQRQNPKHALKKILSISKELTDLFIPNI